MMNALPVLLVVWAVFTGLFLALLAYNATLTRYEENQLFLDEINATEKEQQSAIVRKISKMTPYIRTLGSLSVLMTVVIIGVITWDAWQKIQQ
jgi:predicted membrane-bound spermidine synthase